MLYHQAISVEQANKQSRSVVQHIESIRDQVKRYQTVRAGHVLSSLCMTVAGPGTLRHPNRSHNSPSSGTQEKMK
jgi:hypothetical protein